jgi:hypothetical protein
MKNGTIVFRADEVDDDGEIPAPFCYQKNKESLGLDVKADNMFGPNGGVNYDHNAIVREQEEEDDLIEQEFTKLKEHGERSNRSFGSDDPRNRDLAEAPSKKLKRQTLLNTLFYNPNNEDYIH